MINREVKNGLERLPGDLEYHIDLGLAIYLEIKALPKEKEIERIIGSP